jgi:hypothetical protein
MATGQPASSSWSWTKRAPFIDPGRRPYRLPVDGGLAGQPTQPVGIRRRGGDLDGAALGIEQTHSSRWRDRSTLRATLPSASWW